MDATTIATLTALGVPTLIAAIAWAVKRLAEAAKIRAEAAKSSADAAKTKAEADKSEADASGRFATVAAESYRDARQDLSECEQVREELRAELDGERRERIALGVRCDQREKSAEKEIGALKARLSELERRSMRPEAT